jgi:plasmid stability protein
MANLQIKNVPEDMHEELRRRAKARRMSVRDYVLDLIARDQKMTTMREWLEGIARLDPIDIGDVTPAELIAKGRVERDAELARRIKGRRGSS